MSACSQCGAPITLTDRAVTCTYCNASNVPAPKEVAVPVPVQLIHNVVVASAASGDTSARCPHCRKLLHGVRVGAIELNGCQGCGGIWITNADARQVLEKPEPIFADLARRCAGNAHGRSPRSQSPQCPVCSAILDGVVTHNIALDICAEHGTWFDANELDLLVRTLRGEIAKPVQIRAGSQAMIKCATCSAALRADQANVTPNGLACELCWRREEAELNARSEAGQRSDGAAALLGIAAVLLGAAARSSRN